jgi:hypothetical protein
MATPVPLNANVDRYGEKARARIVAKFSHESDEEISLQESDPIWFQDYRAMLRNIAISDDLLRG